MPVRVVIADSDERTVNVLVEKFADAYFQNIVLEIITDHNCLGKVPDLDGFQGIFIYSPEMVNKVCVEKTNGCELYCITENLYEPAFFTGEYKIFKDRVPVAIFDEIKEKSRILRQCGESSFGSSIV